MSGVMNEETGDYIKKDDGKTQWSLIPRDFLQALAELFTVGANKYGAHCWRQGTNWSRIIDARDRHLSAWDQGEVCCPRDGQHHLVAVVWNCIVLWWYEQHEIGRDDRADTPWGLLTRGDQEQVKVAPTVGRIEDIRFIEMPCTDKAKEKK